MHFIFRIFVVIILFSLKAKAIVKDDVLTPEEDTRQFCREQNKETQEVFKSEMTFFVEELLEGFNRKIEAVETKLERSLQDLSESFKRDLGETNLKVESSFAHLSGSLNDRLKDTESRMDRFVGNLSESLNQLQSKTNSKIDECIHKASEPIYQHFTTLPDVPERTSVKVDTPATAEWEQNMTTTEPQFTSTTEDWEQANSTTEMQPMLKTWQPMLITKDLEQDIKTTKMSPISTTEMWQTDGSTTGEQSSTVAEDTNQYNSTTEIHSTSTNVQPTGTTPTLTTTNWEYSSTSVKPEYLTTTAETINTTTAETINTTTAETINTTTAETINTTTTVPPKSTTTPKPSRCSSLEFKPINQTKPSDNLVNAGVGYLESTLYVCRAFAFGKQILGKASTSECWIANNNSEFGSKGSVFKEFKVLTNPMNAKLTWKSSSKSESIPIGSVVGSRGMEDGAYYIGRRSLEKNLLPGPINEKTRELTASEDKKVYKFSTYEILICSE